MSKYYLLILFNLCIASINMSSIRTFEHKVINILPHHTQFFTQGIDYHHGYLYESTGLYGHSQLIKYQLDQVLPVGKKLIANLFTEGIASHHSSLYQMTWREGITLVHHMQETKSLLQLGQGWGLCSDGAYLIQSDGSNRLYYRHKDMSPAFHIDIYHHGSPVGYLNDLTLHQGYIIANVWFLDILLVITPHHGQVVGIIDLSYLRKMFPKIQAGDVLNGVCTMPDGNLLITGKNWPYFFHIKVNLRPNELDKIHFAI